MTQGDGYCLCDAFLLFCKTFCYKAIKQHKNSQMSAAPASAHVTNSNEFDMRELAVLLNSIPDTPVGVQNQQRQKRASVAEDDSGSEYDDSENQNQQTNKRRKVKAQLLTDTLNCFWTRWTLDENIE
jgi:hypothetical protein